MKPSFFKGLSWLLILNLLVKPVWIFLIDRQVQLSVGNDAYGSYFALLNLSYILLFLADAGLSNMLNQRVASGQSMDTGQLFRLKLLLLLLYALACLVTGWIVGIDRWDLLLYITAIQCLTTLFVFVRSLISAHQFFTTDAVFSVIDKTAMILICGSLIYTSWFGHLNLLLFLKIQVLCTALSIAAGFGFIFRKKLFHSGTRETPTRLVIFMLPFAVSILLMTIHYRLDGFLLERLVSALEAGIYALAFRLLDAGNMVGFLAASLLVPFIARHYTDNPLIERTVLYTRHGLVLLSMAVVSFALVFAPWIQQVLYHTRIPYHSTIIRLCLATLPAYFLTHVYGSMLTATRRFRPFLVIMAVSVVINLVLNLILIPRLGAKGSCISALVSQYACAGGLFLAANRSFRIAPGYRWMLGYLLFGILLTAFFYGAQMAISNVWIILATAATLILLLLATQGATIKKYFISLR